jgi:hypothetical protein
MMMKMPGKMKTIEISTCLFIAFVISLSCAHASALSNAQEAWNPSVTQGRIIEVGSDYLIVQEEKVVLLNTFISGKKVQTRISDGRGMVLDAEDLRKGKIVFVKGCLAFDDKTQSNVLLATDIYVVPRLLTPHDVKEYKDIMEPAEHW